MLVNLYEVLIQHKATKEKVRLKIWAEDTDAATHKCTPLFDHNGEYRWCGTGPVYENNQLVTKEIK